MVRPEAALNHQVTTSVDHTLDLSMPSILPLRSRDLTFPQTTI
jgi:hypothetical protein